MALHKRVKHRLETLAPETSGHSSGAFLKARTPRDCWLDCRLGR
jgi:hypothetical protein